MSSTIAIVGSILMESWFKTEKVVKPGERRIDAELTEYPGGKGATQAVAASRLGATVSLVGSIADDERGAVIKSCLAAEAVQLDGVTIHEQEGGGLATGVGFVQMPESGRYATLVAPGVSSRVTTDDVDRLASTIADADVLIVHCELDEAVSTRAIEVAARSSTTVVLDAAPPERATSELLGLVQVLVVTEDQGRRLLGKAADDCTEQGLARRLASRGSESVVVLLAPKADTPRAALLFDGEDVVRFEGSGKHKLADELGAKDAFVAGLGVRLADGGRLRDAVQWGLSAAELAASNAGGIPALPTRESVEAQFTRTVNVEPAEGV